MFINPIWDHESQRIGKQRCTPVGYFLHGLSDLVGLIAALSLLAAPAYIAVAAFRGRFVWSSLWLLLVPFAIALAGNILHSYSWHLAEKKSFRYDSEKCVSTWIEAGEMKSYKFGSSGDDGDAET